MQFPPAMKIHNVFHLNFLQKALTDPLIGQINKPVPSIVMNNEEKLEVEDIFDTKNH